MFFTSRETCSLRLDPLTASGVAGWVAVWAVVISSPLYIDVHQYLDAKKVQTSSRRAFNASRRFFSLRRYHIHCPIFSASTKPALVRIFMWCETVGCDKSTLASMSQAHMPLAFSIEQQPFSFNSVRMRLRVGSAIADSAVFSSIAIDSHQYTLRIDECQY